MKKIALLVLSLALSACTSFGGIPGVASEQSNAFVQSSYQAVDQLVAASQSKSLVTPGRKVLVATIVNLNDLNESSPFGRLVAEHASSRLVQLGAHVSELKLRGNLFVSEKQGELLLSREVKEISNSYNTDAILVGTYTEAIDRVYVTLKLVRAQDAQIVSAYNYSIEKYGTIGGLLLPARRNPCSWCLAKP